MVLSLTRVMIKSVSLLFVCLFLVAGASSVGFGENKRPLESKETKKLEKAFRRALKARKKIENLSIVSARKNFSSQVKSPKKRKPPFDMVPAHLPVIKVKSEAKIVFVHQMVVRGQQLLRATPAVFPVRGRISSSFGPRRHPKSQDYKIHAGIDIVARFGAPVVATADGRVVFSGNRAGYGKVVVLDHGFGYQTVYAHNSRIAAPMGARVARGQLIAYVGATGHTTGPHLHYEVRKNGYPVDPAPFLRPQPAKL